MQQKVVALAEQQSLQMLTVNTILRSSSPKEWWVIPNSSAIHGLHSWWVARVGLQRLQPAHVSISLVTTG